VNVSNQCPNVPCFLYNLFRDEVRGKEGFFPNLNYHPGIRNMSSISKSAAFMAKIIFVSCYDREFLRFYPVTTSSIFPSVFLV
jgi:hypothetical protein